MATFYNFPSGARSLFFWVLLHSNICFKWKFGLRRKLITSSYYTSFSYRNRERFRAKKWKIIPCWILWHTFVIVISKMMDCFSQTYSLCDNAVLHKLWSINLHIKLRKFMETNDLLLYESNFISLLFVKM